MKTINRIPESTAMCDYTCTELELHAFVDGELADRERANVIMAALYSDTIRKKIGELQLLKQVVHTGYK